VINKLHIDCFTQIPSTKSGACLDDPPNDIQVNQLLNVIQVNQLSNVIQVNLLFNVIQVKQLLNVIQVGEWLS
jgi:hypothetical protein